jgi:hypothetical protein
VPLLTLLALGVAGTARVEALAVRRRLLPPGDLRLWQLPSLGAAASLIAR